MNLSSAERSTYIQNNINQLFHTAFAVYALWLVGGEGAGLKAHYKYHIIFSYYYYCMFADEVEGCDTLIIFLNFLVSSKFYAY